MAHAGPRGIEVASQWRRLAAVVLDFVVLGLPVIGASIGVAALVMRHRLRAGDTGGSPPDLAIPAPWKPAIWVGLAGLDVAGRNWCPPGYRALGLGRVDVHDEARRQALTDAFAGQRVSCLAGCAPGLIRIAVIQAPALWSPLNQTLADRISATVVVRE